MPEKQTTAEGRALKADLWLNRQPLNRFHNSKQEKVIAFKKRLNDWANHSSPSEIAPSFHLAQI